MLKPEEISRYSRQIILPGFDRAGQERLQAAKVLVIGGGGLGVPLLQYLAGMGVGTLGVVDDDEVEESNLHRQVIYTTSDVGRMKVKVLKERLPKLNPHVRLQVHAQRLTAKNAEKVFADYDIIADGSDNFQTKYLVNDTCVALEKPLVYGAVLGFDGQLSVFNLKDRKGKAGPNYRDLFPDLPEDMPDCVTGGVLGVVPGIIGSLMALEVAKLATGIGQPLAGRVLSFDGLRHRFAEVSLLPLEKAETPAKAEKTPAPKAPPAAQVQETAPLPPNGSPLAAESTDAPADGKAAELAAHTQPTPQPEPAPEPELHAAQFMPPAADSPQPTAELKAGDGAEIVTTAPAADEQAADDLVADELADMAHDPTTPATTQRKEVGRLSPQELEQWAEEERAFSLIDLREPNEHQLVNIGGRLIPFSRLEGNLSRFRPDVTYVLYCKSGARSKIGAELLFAHGIRNVYSLEGGILRYIREVQPELKSY